MKNLYTGEIEITLSGRTFLLKYTLNDLLAVKQKFGAIDELEKDLETIRFLVRLGIKERDGGKLIPTKMTEEEVGDLMDVRDLGPLSRAIDAAFGEGPEDGKKGGAGVASDGAVSGSGATFSPSPSAL